VPKEEAGEGTGTRAHQQGAGHRRTGVTQRHSEGNQTCEERGSRRTQDADSDHHPGREAPFGQKVGILRRQPLGKSLLRGCEISCTQLMKTVNTQLSEPPTRR
jgi:hypothetical protein